MQCRVQFLLRLYGKQCSALHLLLRLSRHLTSPTLHPTRQMVRKFGALSLKHAREEIQLVRKREPVSEGETREPEVTGDDDDIEGQSEQREAAKGGLAGRRSSIGKSKEGRGKGGKEGEGRQSEPRQTEVFLRKREDVLRTRLVKASLKETTTDRRVEKERAMNKLENLSVQAKADKVAREEEVVVMAGRGSSGSMVVVVVIVVVW